MKTRTSEKNRILGTVEALVLSAALLLGALPAKAQGIKDEIVAKSLESKLTSQADALEAVESVPAAEGGKKPFKLTGVISSLTISKEGTIFDKNVGISQSLVVDWVRVSADHKAEVPSPAAKINIADKPSEMTIEKVTAQLEPVLQTAEASKKVTNPWAMRKNIKATLEKFLTTIQAITQAPAWTGWHATGLQMEIEIGADGEVGPVALGAGLVVRFNWERSQANAEKAEAEPIDKGMQEKGQQQERENVQNFLSGIADHLNYTMGRTRPKANTFALSEIDVAIGMSAEGSIGIANANAGVTATLIFTRSEGAMPPDAIAVDQPKLKPIWFFKQAPGSNKMQRLSIGQRVKDKFRHSLQRSMNLGLKLAAVASRINAVPKKWKVFDVQTELELSNGYEFGPVTASGSRAVTLVFKDTTSVK